MIIKFYCVDCGVHVTTLRYLNYRTIPPSMDERDLCDECKRRATMADPTSEALNIMVRSTRNSAIEDCIAILRPTLMQDDNPETALMAGRFIEKMRALKMPEPT